MAGRDHQRHAEQITDRIEKKLEELPYLDFVRSYTKPGESVVFVNLKDTVAARSVPDSGIRCARRWATSARPCRPDISGPFYNDEFGDTYSLIYALDLRRLHPSRAARLLPSGMRAELLRVPDVAKVDLIGAQDEKIYLEFSSAADRRTRPRRRAR